MLSRYARNECLATVVIAVSLAISCYFFGVLPLAVLPLAAGACILLFYRDPRRISPKDRNVAVSPADGKISSIHEVAYFEPFGGPAVCVRVFLSIFDVHVNYCPCHAEVKSITHKPGEHMSVLNPHSAEVNEAITIVFNHPTHKTPLVAVRQIAGQFARTVHCALQEGQVVQRGAKLGIMKLGSTAELYLPVAMDQVLVRPGQRVVGAITPLAVLPAKPMNDSGFGGDGETGLRLRDPAPAAELDEDPSLAPDPTIAVTALPESGVGLEAPAPPPAEERADAAPQSDAGEFRETETAVITAILPNEPTDGDGDASAQSSGDLTDHAISQVMAADEVTDTSHTLSASGDGEVLTARMENAGTDLMLHPAEHGEENESLAASLAGLRPETDTSADDAMMRDVLPETLPMERQPGAELAEDSGDWKIVPPGKKTKKPQSDGLLWEEAK